MIPVQLRKAQLSNMLKRHYSNEPEWHLEDDHVAELKLELEKLESVIEDHYDSKRDDEAAERANVVWDALKNEPDDVV